MQLFIALALTVVAAQTREDDPGPAYVHEEIPAVPYIHIDGPSVSEAPVALPYIHIEGPGGSDAPAALPYIHMEPLPNVWSLDSRVARLGWNGLGLAGVPQLAGVRMAGPAGLVGLPQMGAIRWA